jgi:pimeloyl-ACP methyl ester carboxylesterase
MKAHKHLLGDLKGKVQLSADAVLAISDLVEALHGKISAPFRIGPSGAIAKFVYGSVRGITKGVAKTAHAVLDRIPSASPADASTAQVEATFRGNLLSIVNGVCGDHLSDSANTLALPMQLLGPIAASSAAAKKYALFIHGLCLNDSHWRADAHVAAVEKLGFTPIFLRYNSGLAIASNGVQLSQLMQEKLSRPGVQVAVIAHSMGGLVMRSALAHAKQTKQRWPNRLTALVFLGTPHLGAPLEQAGYWVHSIWQSIPYAKALAPIAKLRSVGIQDLRHGKTHDDIAVPIKLPSKLPCFAIAASLSSKRGGIKDRLLGDGLVPVESALGVTYSARLIPEQNCATFYEIGHLELLYAPAVTAQVERWLADIS